ncbi:MAG: heavy metal translocating P-type ATPase [Clostridia bacterium]
MGKHEYSKDNHNNAHDNCAHNHGHMHDSKLKCTGDGDLSEAVLNPNGHPKGCTCPECSCGKFKSTGEVDCHHCHNHGEMNLKRELITILVSAVLFGTAFLFSGTFQLVIFLVSFLIAGFGVLKEAVTSIFSGSFFDENFLMSIATICALIIGETPEAVMVMLLFRIGEMLQGIAIKRSRVAINNALDLHIDIVHVYTNGDDTEDMEPDKVKVGDRIAIYPGERIPMDGRIIIGGALIDYSAITGESVPVSANIGEMATSGGIVSVRSISVSVTALYFDSTAARIMRSVEDASEGKPKLENLIRRFARTYTPCVVIAAILLAILPPLFSLGTFSEWIYRAMLFLVISCPCALVLSVPLTFFTGLASAGKHGILFKTAGMMESASKIKTIAFDKTGTLTTGNFKVHSVESFFDAFNKEKVLAYAAAIEIESAHPIARTIAAFKSDEFIGEDIVEYTGRGVSGIVNGKETAVGSPRLLRELSIDTGDFSGILVAIDGVCVGAIKIVDELKDGARNAIEYVKSSGIHSILLTGDAEESARETAKMVGIDDYKFSLLPMDKLEIMKDMRKKTGSVMFIGDGTNDAPVLAGSNIGVAMGAMGTDAAIEAADVVIMGDEIAAIPTMLKLSRRTMHIARFNIAFALIIKMLAMILGIFGICEMWMAVVADVGTTLICVLIAATAGLKK